MNAQHLYEKAAQILEVALDASPVAIRAAYGRAKALAAKPICLIEMAYEVLITATADYRVKAVEAYHRAARYAGLSAQMDETPEEKAVRLAHSRDADRRRRLLAGKTGVDRSIAALHVALGQY